MGGDYKSSATTSLIPAAPLYQSNAYCLPEGKGHAAVADNRIPFEVADNAAPGFELVENLLWCAPGLVAYIVFHRLFKPQGV